MTNPLFSIILPTHGRPDLLREALASILRQSIRDFECIIVQDAGPERARLTPDPRVRVIRRENRGGAAAARNTGLYAARGRYVTFLDDDDLFTPDRLEIALEGLAQAPVALCWRESTSNHSQVITWSDQLGGDLRQRILQAPVPNVGQVAMRLELTPSFDERFRVSEDVEWWLRAARVGDAVTIERVGYTLRQHSGERQTDRLADRLACRLLLLETHADYFAANQKAASYQWRRVGGLAGAMGARRFRSEAFKRAFALDPRVVGLGHLALSYWPPLRRRDDPNHPTATGS